MSSSTSLQVFDLSVRDIDCSGPWLLWLQEADEPFLDSVRTFGVLEPVLVTKRGDTWQLVSGWKRLSVCRGLGLPVPCLAVQGDDVHLARMYLHLNVQHVQEGPGALQWVRCVQGLLDERSAWGVAARELRPLLPANVWRALTGWAAADATWDPLIVQKHVPFDLGRTVAGCSVEEVRDLRPVFAHFAWSVNKARQVVTWLIELARCRQVAVHEVVHDLEIPQLLKRDVSPKDGQQAVVDRIRQARFPLLSRLESDFDRLRAEAVHSLRWQIQAEQHFETNGVILTSRVRSQAEAEQALGELQSLVTSSAFTRIWSWQERELDG